MIREYREKDFERVVDLMNEFGDYLVEIDMMRRSRREPGFGSFFAKKMISETLGEGLVLVVELDGQVVAFAAGVVQAPASFDHLQAIPARSGRITELYVSKNHRQQGLGQELVDRLENHFNSMGCDVMRVEVFEPNYLAHRFYAKHGYRDRMIDMIKELRDDT